MHDLTPSNILGQTSTMGTKTKTNQRQTNLALVEHLAPAHVLGQLLPQRVVRLLSLQDHVVQVLRDPHLLVGKEEQCKGSVVI